jgi:hypothetical protein
MTSKAAEATSSGATPAACEQGLRGARSLVNEAAG